MPSREKEVVDTVTGEIDPAPTVEGPGGSFDPTKHISLLPGSGNRYYLEVKWRLVWLRSVDPDAQIFTELVQLDSVHRKGEADPRERALFKAEIVLSSGGRATGYGFAMFGSGGRGDPGFPEFLEKAETKAIGRALGFLGFGTQFTPEIESDGTSVADSPVRRNDPMQEGQWKFIQNLVAEIQMDDFDERVAKRFDGKKAKDLTKDEARILIDSLKKIRDDQPKS